MGRLTRDPELRYTQSNIPVVTFSIAVDRNYSNNGGDRQTDFIDIVAWRRTAEFVSQWFTKGQMIVVVGSIQSRRWQDKNGNNRESKRSRESGGSYPNNNGGYPQNGGYQNPNPYAAPQQSAPAPSFDMPAGNSDFAEISDDDGEVPF